MINNPLDVPNCVVWLDGADLTTMGQSPVTGPGDVGNGLPVRLWKNKAAATVNDFDFTKNVSGTDSVYMSSLSGVYFSSNTALSSNRTITYNNGHTIIIGFLPFDPGNFNSYRTIIFKHYLTGQDSRNFAPIERYSGSYQFRYTNNGTTYADYTTSKVAVESLSGLCVLEKVFDGVNQETLVSNLQSNTSLTNNFNGGTIDVTELGTAGSEGGLLGVVNEVAIFDRVLTLKERSEVYYYLYRKYKSIEPVTSNRKVFAVKNGLWSDALTWSISSDPSPFNTLFSSDSVYSNGQQVTVDVSAQFKQITNQGYPLNMSTGGSFTVNSVSLSGFVFGGYNNPTILIPNGVTCNIYGNIEARSVSTDSFAVSGGGNSNLYVNGDLFSIFTTRKGCVLWDSTGNFTLDGNINGASGSVKMIQNINSGNVYMKGDINFPYGSNAASHRGIINESTGSVFLTGNIYNIKTQGYQNYGIYNTGDGSVHVLGNSYAGTGGSNNSHGIAATKGNVYVEGNLGGSWSGTTGNTNYGLYALGTASCYVNSKEILSNWYGHNSSTNGGVYAVGTANVEITALTIKCVGPAPAITCGSDSKVKITCPNIVTNIANVAIESTSTQPVSCINVEKLTGSVWENYQPILAKSLKILPKSGVPHFLEKNTNFYGTTTKKLYMSSDYISTNPFPPQTAVLKNTVYGAPATVGTSSLPPLTSVALGIASGPAVKISNLITKNYYQIINDNLAFLDVGSSSYKAGTNFYAKTTAEGFSLAQPLGTACIPFDMWSVPLSSKFITFSANTVFEKASNGLTTRELTAITHSLTSI